MGAERRFAPLIGKGPARGGDGCGENWDGSWRPQHGGLQPGVGGMLRTGKHCTAQETKFRGNNERNLQSFFDLSFSAGFVSANSEQVHPSQPGVEERPYRKFGEKAGGTSQLCSKLWAPAAVP